LVSFGKIWSLFRNILRQTVRVTRLNGFRLFFQVVAVTENLSQGVYTNSTDINSLLLSEGSNLANKLNAHFMTSMSAIPQKCEWSLFITS
jgi:hypothetical protein